jgi:GNAT superfamily N-acetyltransferase
MDNFMLTSLAFALRPVTLNDLESVYELMEHNALSMVGYSDNSLTDMRIDWTNEGDTLGETRRIALTPEGPVVGFAEVDQDLPALAFVDIYVREDMRETTLGHELLAWSEATARARAAEPPEGQRCQMRAWSYAEDVRHYQPLLVAHGFSLIRHFVRMRIDFDTPPSPAVVPAGFTIRTAEPGEERAIAAVARLSFQDHYGYVERTPEAHFSYWWDDYWRDRMRYDQWWLALKDDQIVGVCLGENAMNDDTSIGWIGTLGVLREFRRQGLAGALLRHSFHAFAAQGKRSVALGVDAASLTSAVNLYLNAGMRVVQRYDLFEKELRPGLDITRRTLED